jgi:diguanylate cyclase (GGDEF)-like protein
VATVSTFKYSKRRLQRALVVGGGLFFAIYATGTLLRPSELYLRFQTDILYELPVLVALGVSAVAIAGSRGRERVGWVCMAFVLFAWLLGDSTYSYYDLALDRETPFPGWADVWYYAGYLAFIAAIPLLMFPKEKLRDYRWLVDAGIIMIVGGALAWQYVLDPIVMSEGSYREFGTLVSLGYPLLDIVLLGALVTALYATNWQWSTRGILLIAATAATAVSDIIYTYLTAVNGYDQIGSPLDLGWIASYVLLAICFATPGRPMRRVSERRPSLVGLVLPYAAATPLLALVIAETARGEPPLMLMLSATVCMALVLVRQFLTLRENLSFEGKLRYAATHDQLAGIGNRHHFEEDVESHLALARKTGAGGALLFLDLDDFKALNDELGHRAGDRFLADYAAMLRDQFGTTGCLARWGGDEFALLAPDVDARGARKLANRILRATGEHVTFVDGKPMRTSASIGIALTSRDGETADEVLTCAGLALKEAKERGRNRVVRFGGRKRSRPGSWLDWNYRISQALERDQFVLYCQPVFDLRSRAIHQYEVLLRMTGDRDELIPPQMFLPAAERSGAILEIDRWVLSRATAVMSERQRRGLNTQLAVNISGKSLADNSFLQFALRTLASSGANATWLTLEITETAIIPRIRQAQRFVKDLKMLGCRFAVDDFGAGFTSLETVRQFPADYLKIDGRFVRDLARRRVDQYLIRAIVEIARGLGQRTIAEYVSDAMSVQLLRECGVDFGQGFYLGRPIPLEEALGATEVTDQRSAA